MREHISEKIPVVAIVGPTASGKTALAVLLAKQYQGEIISADSMQIYQGLDRATAKPTVDEMQGIPHHLLSFLSKDVTYSVADYVQDASKVIQDVFHRGHLPIVTGGTGLYVRSLLDGIQFYQQNQEESPAVRLRLQQEAENFGGDFLHRRLSKIDPVTAAAVHPNNVGRVIRALEVYELTGIPLSQQKEKSRPLEKPYRSCCIGLNYADRQILYERIHLRVDRMLQEGLLDEVKEAIYSGVSPTQSQAIGYKELLPYFNERQPLENCIEQIKKSTRHYAKRQLTWFRREKDIQWILMDQLSSDKELLEKCNEIMRKFNVISLG